MNISIDNDDDNDWSHVINHISNTLTRIDKITALTSSSSKSKKKRKVKKTITINTNSNTNAIEQEMMLMAIEDVNMSSMSNILDNKIHTIIENIIISTIKVNDNTNTTNTNDNTTNTTANESVDKDNIWLVLAIKATVNANKKIIFRLVSITYTNILINTNTTTIVRDNDCRKASNILKSLTGTNNTTKQSSSSSSSDSSSKSTTRSSHSSSRSTCSYYYQKYCYDYDYNHNTTASTANNNNKVFNILDTISNNDNSNNDNSNNDNNNSSNETMGNNTITNNAITINDDSNIIKSYKNFINFRFSSTSSQQNNTNNTNRHHHSSSKYDSSSDNIVMKKLGLSSLPVTDIIDINDNVDLDLTDCNISR